MTGQRRKLHLPAIICGTALVVIALHIVHIHAQIENLQKRIHELQQNEILHISALRSVLDTIESVERQHTLTAKSIWNTVRLVLETEHILRYNNMEEPKLIYASLKNYHGLGGGE